MLKIKEVREERETKHKVYHGLAYPNSTPPPQVTHWDLQHYSSNSITTSCFAGAKQSFTIRVIYPNHTSN